MVYMEQVPQTDDGAESIAMLFGDIVVYDIDAKGHMVHKEVRHVEGEVKA